jgi:hypothetical protein
MLRSASSSIAAPVLRAGTTTGRLFSAVFWRRRS